MNIQKRIALKIEDILLQVHPEVQSIARKKNQEKMKFVIVHIVPHQYFPQDQRIHCPKRNVSDKKAM